MSTPLIVTLPDLKAYLGITTTADDVLLASIASNVTVTAEADTGRYLAVRSNHTERYSTAGQASLNILDVPYSDPTRTVTLLGAAIVQDSTFWLIPDRRDTDAASTIQLRHYDTSQAQWYKAAPTWFDAGLDRQRYPYGSQPNDLVVTGVHGHPDQTQFSLPLLELGAWLYYRAKSGASGVVKLPSGEEVDLADHPTLYKQFVSSWRVTTGVSVVG